MAILLYPLGLCLQIIYTSSLCKETIQINPFRFHPSALRHPILFKVPSLLLCSKHQMTRLLTSPTLQAMTILPMSPSAKMIRKHILLLLQILVLLSIRCYLDILAFQEFLRQIYERELYVKWEAS